VTRADENANRDQREFWEAGVEDLERSSASSACTGSRGNNRAA
jgi:hypothetical protein